MIVGKRGTEPMANDEILLYRLSQAEKHIAEQAADIERLNTKLNEMRIQDAAREKKQLMWGITTLGAVVMTLGGVLWAYRGIIFRGSSE